jgi:hypothetical protein
VHANPGPTRLAAWMSSDNLDEASVTAHGSAAFNLSILTHDLSPRTLPHTSLSTQRDECGEYDHVCCGDSAKNTKDTTVSRSLQLQLQLQLQPFCVAQRFKKSPRPKTPARSCKIARVAVRAWDAIGTGCDRGGREGGGKGRAGVRVRQCVLGAG